LLGTRGSFENRPGAGVLRSRILGHRQFIRPIKTILARFAAQRVAVCPVDSAIAKKSIVTAVGYYGLIRKRIWDSLAYCVSNTILIGKKASGVIPDGNMLNWQKSL
jgi:hypothetical protein